MTTTEAAARTCRTVWNPYWGWTESCSTPTRQRLESNELAETERKIADWVHEHDRYDVLAALVALPDGGYNIVLHNLRSKEDVKGLCDPSIIAFSMAEFTAGTTWKSRNLQIWLEPYADGWTIPTRGSRTALAKGKQASRLGFLGVVDVKALRTWLEKTFRPLPAPIDERHDQEPSLPPVFVERLPVSAPVSALASAVVLPSEAPSPPSPPSTAPAVAAATVSPPMPPLPVVRVAPGGRAAPPESGPDMPAKDDVDEDLPDERAARPQAAGVPAIEAPGDEVADDEVADVQQRAQPLRDRDGVRDACVAAYETIMVQRCRVPGPAQWYIKPCVETFCYGVDRSSCVRQARATCNWDAILKCAACSP